MERGHDRKGLDPRPGESHRFGHEERLGQRRDLRCSHSYERWLPRADGRREEAHPPRVIVPSFLPHYPDFRSRHSWNSGRSMTKTYNDVHAKIPETILEHMPKDAEITRIEFEGPRLP